MNILAANIGIIPICFNVHLFQFQIYKNVKGSLSYSLAWNVWISIKWDDCLKWWENEILWNYQSNDYWWTVFIKYVFSLFFFLIFSFSLLDIFVCLDLFLWMQIGNRLKAIPKSIVVVISLCFFSELFVTLFSQQQRTFVRFLMVICNK